MKFTASEVTISRWATWNPKPIMSNYVTWQSVHHVKLIQIMSLLCQIIFPIIFPIMSNLNYYFTFYVKLFEFFFLLFPTSPVHRSWQIHKLVLCTEKGLISNEEGQLQDDEGSLLCQDTSKYLADSTLLYSFFFHYTHYFTSLTRIEQQISSNYALQGNVQWTQVIR